MQQHQHVLSSAWQPCAVRRRRTLAQVLGRCRQLAKLSLAACQLTDMGEQLGGLSALRSASGNSLHPPPLLPRCCCVAAVWRVRMHAWTGHSHASQLLSTFSSCVAAVMRHGWTR